MIKIKYNNSDTLEEVTFCRMDNLVTITPTTTNPSGFTTWKLDGKTQLGDFSDFNTVFRVENNSVTYSNNGSVYVEPKKIEIELSIDEQYQNLVVSLIRQKYSINDELAILRQRDEKSSEYKAYFTYCEECKTKAKNELGI